MQYDHLKGYEISLNRVTEDKIELIRQWRNSPKISQYMKYRGIISEEDQKQWFKSVNNEKNLYYIIEYKGAEIGLINIKDIKDHSGEGGIFIYEDKYLNTDLSYRAHICLFDFFFLNYNGMTIRSEIIKENTRALRFAQFLGCKIIEELVWGYNLILYKDDYLNNINRLRFIKKEEFLSHQ